MPVKPGWVDAGERGQLGYSQRGSIPPRPSQAAQLDPGDKHSSRQLLVEDHAGGDENSTWREERYGDHAIFRIVSIKNKSIQLLEIRHSANQETTYTSLERLVQKYTCRSKLTDMK